MSDHIQKTIADVQSQVQSLERELLEKKRMVNSLCKLAGKPPAYGVIEHSQDGSLSIRPGEFFGQPLSTVVRWILEKRKAAGLEAASVAEIYDAMVEGEYDFGKTSSTNSKKNLRISMTKNSATFYKLPSGKYGLLEWYPEVQKKKKKNGNEEQPSEDDDSADRAAMEDEFGEQAASKDDAPTKAEVMEAESK